MRRPPHVCAPRSLSSDRTLSYFLLLPPLPCQTQCRQQNHAYSGVNRAAFFPHPAASLVGLPLDQAHPRLETEEAGAAC